MGWLRLHWSLVLHFGSLSSGSWVGFASGQLEIRLRFATAGAVSIDWPEVLIFHTLVDKIQLLLYVLDLFPPLLLLLLSCFFRLGFLGEKSVEFTRATLELFPEPTAVVPPWHDEGSCHFPARFVMSEIELIALRCGLERGGFVLSGSEVRFFFDLSTHR